MSNLLDTMVAVAVLGIGGAIIAGHGGRLERANQRAYAVESVARALDQEMERFRACPDRACVDQLAARAPEEHTREVASWSGAEIERKIESGPSGTLKVILKASIPGSRIERKLSALIWVAP